MGQILANDTCNVLWILWFGLFTNPIMRTAHYVSFTSRALQISNPHRTADRPIHTVCQSYFCTMHFQLSQWSKPQKLHRPPFKWTAKRLLWYPFQCVEWKVTSVTATQFYGAFIPRNLHSFFLKFDCRSVIIQTHLAVCFLIVIWKTYVFYEPQFCGISLNILLSGKSVKLEKGRNTRRRRVFLPTSFVL